MLIKKKMQEMAELKKMRENQGEAERRTMDKADTVVEKHQKIIAVSQNILRVWHMLDESILAPSYFKLPFTSHLK